MSVPPLLIDSREHSQPCYSGLKIGKDATKTFISSKSREFSIPYSIDTLLADALPLPVVKHLKCSVIVKEGGWT